MKFVIVDGSEKVEKMLYLRGVNNYGELTVEIATDAAFENSNYLLQVKTNGDKLYVQTSSGFSEEFLPFIHIEEGEDEEEGHIAVEQD